MPAIHSITLGSGPDVVLLHPFPLTHEFWLPVAHRLADTYRVTLYDLRGLGRSTDLGDDVSMQTHAYDLSLVCKQNGIERAVFLRGPAGLLYGATALPGGVILR